MAEASFNQDSLRRDLVRVWGEDSPQLDVFDHMAKHVAAVPELRAELARLMGDRDRVEMSDRAAAAIAEFMVDDLALRGV